MSALNRFVSQYSYIKQETWPDEMEFSQILNSLSDESCIGDLETIQFNHSIVILMGLFHLIWNYHNESMTDKMEELITKCDSCDYQSVIYYFQGKLKSLQKNELAALKFYKKAEETLPDLNNSDNQQLSKLLIAMGSMEDFSLADQSEKIFSVVLLIDTALSHIKSGNKRGIQYLKTAVEKQKIIYKTENHPNVAYTLRLIAQAYIDADEVTEATPYINSAIQIANLFYSYSHPEFISIMELREQQEMAMG